MMAQAHQDAEAQVKAMLAHVAESEWPHVIKLSDFPDEATYQLLCGRAETHSLAYHRAVNRAMAEQLNHHGFKVRWIQLQQQELEEWLDENELDDLPTHRAEFVSYKLT